MAINRYMVHAQAPQNQQFYQLPFNQIYQALQSKQLEQDTRLAKAQELGLKVNEVNRLDNDSDIAEYNKWVDGIRSQVMDLSNQDLTTTEGKRTFRDFTHQIGKDFSPTGIASAFQGRYDSYAKQVQDYKDFYENNPELAKYYSNIINKGEFDYDAATRDWTNPTAGQQHYQDISDEEIGTMINQAVDNIHDTFLGVDGFSTQALNDFRIAYQTGEWEGRGYDDIFTALVNQVATDDVLRSEQQSENAAAYFQGRTPNSQSIYTKNAEGEVVLNPNSNLLARVQGAALGRARQTYNRHVGTFEDKAYGLALEDQMNVNINSYLTSSGHDYTKETFSEQAKTINGLQRSLSTKLTQLEGTLDKTALNKRSNVEGVDIGAEGYTVKGNDLYMKDALGNVNAYDISNLNNTQLSNLVTQLDDYNNTQRTLTNYTQADSNIKEEYGLGTYEIVFNPANNTVGTEYGPQWSEGKAQDAVTFQLDSGDITTLNELHGNGWRNNNDLILDYLNNEKGQTVPEGYQLASQLTRFNPMSSEQVMNLQIGGYEPAKNASKALADNYSGTMYEVNARTTGSKQLDNFFTNEGTELFNGVYEDLNLTIRDVTTGKEISKAQYERFGNDNAPLFEGISVEHDGMWAYYKPQITQATGMIDVLMGEDELSTDYTKAYKVRVNPEMASQIDNLWVKGGVLHNPLKESIVNSIDGAMSQNITQQGIDVNTNITSAVVSFDNVEYKIKQYPTSTTSGKDGLNTKFSIVDIDGSEVPFNDLNEVGDFIYLNTINNLTK